MFRLFVGEGEAMKTTLDMAREAGAIHIHGNSKEFAIVGNDSIKAFEALVLANKKAAPVQEPVAQSLIKALTHAVEIAEAKRPGTWDDLLQYRVLLNTPPAQRQWDYDTLYAAWHAVGADVAGLKWETFVAKLKEKNT
jgi:hypothetical protein